MSVLPEYGIPYGSENYTGPYLSDGKLQTSVEFGSAEPQSKLDALSRLHDSAYAKFTDSGHRYAADSIYNEEAKKLMGTFPSLAGSAVLYGNATSKSVSNLASGLTYGLPGLVYGAVKNVIDLNDKLMNGDRYRKEVKSYYATDPFKDVYQSAKYMPEKEMKSVNKAAAPQLKKVEQPTTQLPPVYTEANPVNPPRNDGVFRPSAGPSRPFFESELYNRDKALQNVVRAKPEGTAETTYWPFRKRKNKKRVYIF